jgi:hypothetical protein
VAEYIFNLRRAPRAPARCAAHVQVPGSGWSSETEDFGPSGCQLVAPGAVPRGLQLLVVLTHPGLKEPLRVTGRVAWATSRPPWRVGVAFADPGKAQASAWFTRLVAAHPRLGTLRRVPDRLPIDAMLFLGPPPGLLVDFTPEEVEVVRHVAAGTTVESLRTRLGSTWPSAQRGIFSLLARGLLTVSRSTSAHPTAWKKVMAELGTDFVLEMKHAPRTTPLPVADVDWVPPMLMPEMAEVIPEPEPPAPAATPPESPPPLPQPPPAPPHPPPLPVSSAGTGWRGGVRNRSREAQEAFDLGRTELAAGRTSSALAHLRRALQLAQGDSEIAAELGRAMTGTR